MIRPKHHDTSRKARNFTKNIKIPNCIFSKKNQETHIQISKIFKLPEKKAAWEWEGGEVWYDNFLDTQCCFFRTTFKSEKVNFPSPHSYLGEKERCRFYYWFSGPIPIAFNRRVWFGKYLQKSLLHSTRRVQKHLLKIWKHLWYQGLQTCLLLLNLQRCL